MAARKHEINVAVNSKGAPTQLKVLVERLKKMEQQTKKNRKELRSMYTVMHGKPSKDAAKGLEKLNTLMNKLALNASKARREVFALLKGIQAASGKARNINIHVNQKGGGSSAASAVPAAVATSGVGNQARKTSNEVNRMWGAFTGRSSNAALNRLRSINTSARTIATSTILVRRQVLSMFSAFTVGYAATDLLRTVGDFQNMLRTAGALAGATTEEFQELEVTIRNLAKVSPKTATQVAEGALYMARAGFDAKTTINGLDEALLLAEVGLVDMGRSTDIVTNLLTAFQLRTFELSEAVDVMAHAASSGNISIHQMGEGLKFASGTAKKAGVDYKHVIGLLTALGNAGLPSGIAGRGLNQLLIQLAKKGELINGDILPALHKYKDASIETLKDVEKFENNALRALAALTSQIPFVEKLFGELENARGAAQKLADTMREDNLGYELSQLASKLKEVYLRVSDFVDLPGIIKSLGDALDKLGENIEYIIDGIKAIGIAAAAFFGVKITGFILSLIGAFLQLDKFASLLGSLFTKNWVAALGTSASILVGFAGSIVKIAGVAGVVTAMLTAFKDTFKKSDNESVRALGATLQVFVDTVKKIANESFPKIKDFAGKANEWTDVLSDIVHQMSKALVTVKSFVDNIPNMIYSWIPDIFKTQFIQDFGHLLGGAGNLLGYATGPLASGANQVGLPFLAALLNLGPEALKALGAAVTWKPTDYERQQHSIRMNESLFGSVAMENLRAELRRGGPGTYKFTSGLYGEFEKPHADPEFARLENLRNVQLKAAMKQIGEVADPLWMAERKKVYDQLVLDIQRAREIEEANDNKVKQLMLERLVANERLQSLLESADDMSTGVSYGEYRGFGVLKDLKDQSAAAVAASQRPFENQLAKDLEFTDEGSEGNEFLIHSAWRASTGQPLPFDFPDKDKTPKRDIFAELEREMAHRQQILYLSQEEARLKTEIFRWTERAKDLAPEQIQAGIRLIEQDHERTVALERLQSIARTTNDLINTGANTFISSFKRLGDQGVSAAERIKNAFQDAIESIGEQLLRLGFQKAVASLINFAIPGAGLPGFANGGSFRVGGSGGTDSQLVAFRATPNETVSVKTPAQQRMSGGVQVTNVYNTFHLSTYEAEHKIQSMINASEKGTIDKAVQVNASVQRNDPTYFPG